MKRFIFFSIVVSELLCACAGKKKTADIANADSLHCEPGSNTINQLRTARDTSIVAGKTDHKGMVWIPGGEFMMGSKEGTGYADEHPAHPVRVPGFWMDETEVTNRQFSEFVKATGYITVAERKVSAAELAKEANLRPEDIDPGMLEPGSLVFHPTDRPVPLNNPGQWWSWTKNANWRNPQGPGSSYKDDHPVVHIAYEDALAYAKWAGKSLPTEAKWEWAARGGLKDAIYPWGNEPIESNRPKANSWNGTFPATNTNWDGFTGIAPVKQFAPNGYGLYDMSGNVWEWCTDWYRNDAYTMALQQGLQTDPHGPSSSIDPDEPGTEKRVLRGGSFLCNDSYCSGYRVARRMKTSATTSLNHTGFRCIADSVKL